jgi:hypothetical protein
MMGNIHYNMKTTFEHKYNIGDTVFHIDDRNIYEAKVENIFFNSKTGQVEYNLDTCSYTWEDQLFDSKDEATQKLNADKGTKLRGELKSQRARLKCLLADIENIEKELEEFESENEN